MTMGDGVRKSVKKASQMQIYCISQKYFHG